MKWGRAGGRSIAPNYGRESADKHSRCVRSIPRLRQCRLESRKERLPFRGEPLGTVTYISNAKETLVYAARRS
jgi:hypothetical protein